jgi:hypothetical protein
MIENLTVISAIGLLMGALAGITFAVIVLVKVLRK